MVDINQKMFFHFWLVARWLAFRLDWISAVVTGIVSFYTVIANVNPAIAGVTISQALQITGILQWTVRNFSEMEAYMTSVERQLYYMRNLPSEPPRIVEGCDDLGCCLFY
jgi:ATP-binding cassette subfamily C (CFTR/MRP) protein 5